MNKNIILNINKIVASLFIGICPFLGLSQEDEENIGTETVTVVKAYKPTIGDAFKVKSIPNLNDSITLQKKKIKYSIFSVPVASTFTPAKGKASAVKKRKPEELFNSYLSVGLGNYSNALIDFYTSREITRDSKLDIGLTHYSSRGAVEGVALDNDFYNSGLELSYHKDERYFNWTADAGFKHQVANWYGIADQKLTPEVLGTIDSKQTYFTGELGGNINWEDAVIKDANLLIRRFWDATDSGENRLVLEPSFELPIADELFKIKVKADYVGGNFGATDINASINTGEFDYHAMQFGINPGITILRDNLTLNLGASFVYADASVGDGSFYIYPDVTASFRVSGDNVIAYGGLQGELHQNSYYDFVQENPFVSPSLRVAATDKQYNGFAGLKGRLLPNLSYDVKVMYTAENNKALFQLNPENDARQEENYVFGNSFRVVYDDVKTIGFKGGLYLDMSNALSIALKMGYNNYSTESDNPAWNLPEIEGNLLVDYQIGKHWYFGANLFYTGERKDLETIAEIGVLPINFDAETITLDGYFDANLEVGYRFNNQLTFFVKGSNLAGEYNKWAHFPTLGLQVLGGATYKFNF